MCSFHERKAARTKEYMKNQYGWKLVTCGACAGSGRYDHNGNPKCGWCGGTGKTREAPSEQKEIK